MRKRVDRQVAIREVIRSQDVRTQRALAELLRERGHDCTQATISRDITEMGLKKTEDGAYILPEDLRMQRMVRDLVVQVRRAGNLVVVHTSSGTAQGVAASLDAAGLPSILGSVAGDDTVLVILEDAPSAEYFQALVQGLVGETADQP